MLYYTSMKYAKYFSAIAVILMFPALALAKTEKVLAVPFLSQAPLKIWDALHEDACEEASLMMAKAYRNKDRFSNIRLADKELQGVVRLGEKLGQGISISLADLAVLSEKRYSIKAEVKSLKSMDDIRREIDAGRPVIVGAAGKLLKNPNFKNGGPVYHMLVIKGYDDKGFITNDPGTRKGESYYYTEAVLSKAIHDWNPINVLNGSRNYLILKDK